MEKLHHEGTMHTKVDDCQFLCIPQQEYYQILQDVRNAIASSCVLTMFDVVNI